MSPDPAEAAAAPASSVAVAWHRLSVGEVLNRTGSGAAGLEVPEAARRLAADGPNQIDEAKGASRLRILARQFESRMIWILLFAGVLSGLLGELIDAVAILAIVVLNAAIGFRQEAGAEKSIAALKRMTAPRATVRREGRVVAVPAAMVVVGDVLVLAAGDIIAADARLLAAASLRCVESALTGEAAAVAKRPEALEAAELPLGDRTNLVFQGTSVAAGSGEAVVVAVAMRTELGRIAALITGIGAEEPTPLQKTLDAFGRVLVRAAFGVVGLLFGLGLLRGSPPLELLLTSLSLAVAAVPEGLPAVVTVALSLGVLRMARRRALVRRLAAVETLGSTNVICTDKTGTLTVGEMTARALLVDGREYDVTGEGYGPAGEIRWQGARPDASHAAPLGELAAVLLGCNQAHLVEHEGRWRTIGDPTEGALLAVGAKAGGDRVAVEREAPLVREFPFDSDRKRASTLRRRPDGSLRVYCNGAPGVVLGLCTRRYTMEGVVPLTEADREKILARAAGLAGRALRVLASARRDFPGETPAGLAVDAVERDLVFIGLTGMQDPPRPEAREAIARCHDAGIRVVMITGDHPGTAAAIARDLKISADLTVTTGAEMEKMSDEELGRLAPRVAVYARVTAGHKLRIVRALQASGAVVAMTGDGVNDAPAIKGADIGIAMGRTGTEVTKQAADIIITDDDFATIVAAVEEGRGIYDNIRKTLQYLLAGNAGELLFMTICLLAALPVPLLPIHLLWINLVTDGLPALCLAADPIDPDVMKRRPRHRLARLADGRFLRAMAFTGLLTAGVALAVYVCVLRTRPVEAARTAAFTVLVFAELLRAFGARSATKPIWRRPFFSNLPLLGVVAGAVGFQFWSQHNVVLGRFLKSASLPAADFFWLLAAGAIPLGVLEVVKAFRSGRAPAPLGDKGSPAA